MTWTFENDFTTTRDQVRIECGDVVFADQQLDDKAIAYAQTVEGSILSAAARCCEWLQSFYARKADMSEGALRIALSQRAKAYLEKSKELRFRDAITAVPYAGGISIADKENNNNDTDRVPPAFFRGMQDNPIAMQDTPGEVQGDPFSQEQ